MTQGSGPSAPARHPPGTTGINRLLLAGAALIAVLLVSATLNFITTVSQQRDAQAVARTHEVLDTLTHVRAEVSEGRAALRLYVLSGRADDRRAFECHIAQAHRHLDDFSAMTTDERHQQERLQALRADLARLEAVWARGLDAYQRQGQDAAMDIFSPEGRPIADGIQETLRAMAAREKELLAIRAEQSQQAYLVSLWTGLVSGVISVLLVGLYVLLWRQHSRSLARSANQLAGTADRLRAADRRKDQFLAMLAHELRNPLAPIRNATAILVRSPADPARVRWAADIIGRQSQHMRVLLDDLLDMARVTQNKLQLQRQPVPVSAFLDAAIEASRPALDGGAHRLQVERPPADPVVDVDPVRITQVLTNLLNNAARYTPPGGAVTLRLAVEGSDLHIQVQDNGIGIAPEALDRIFEMFEQEERAAQSASGGLGIGLSLNKALVELHGGRIAVRSDGPGQGSTFHVVLPGVLR